MKFYFAPMEGITGFVFRNAHHKLFPGIDRYFTPFYVLNQNFCLKKRDKRDASPEYNPDIPLTPQILTNKPEQLAWGAGIFRSMGYQDLNLNLGCPSGTVVPKHKGAGLLESPDFLKEFFEESFRILQNSSGQNTGGACSISVKTRLGMHTPEEAFPLMEVYNQFPLSDLIIHARVREEYYKGRPHIDIFDECARMSRIPVCYNGDIRTARGYDILAGHWGASPELSGKVHAVMIGRGLVRNPALVREIQGGKPLTYDELLAFHDEVLEGYLETIKDERNAIAKMLELWAAWKDLWEDGEKKIRKIRKAKRLSEYRDAVDLTFSGQSGFSAGGA